MKLGTWWRVFKILISGGSVGFTDATWPGRLVSRLYEYARKLES